MLFLAECLGAISNVTLGVQLAGVASPLGC